MTTVQTIKEKREILKRYMKKINHYDTYYCGVAQVYLTLFQKFDIPKLEPTYTSISDDILFCYFFHYCVNNIFKYQTHYYVLLTFIQYMSFDDPWNMLNLIFVESRTLTNIYVYYREHYENNKTIIKDPNANIFYKLILFDINSYTILAYKLIKNEINDVIILSMSNYEPEMLRLKFNASYQKITLNNDLYFEKKI